MVLVFFFFCLCGWSFGPWELTILTVFLSYSIEPAFHIGHDFINPGLPEALRAEKPEVPSTDLPAIADAAGGADGGKGGQGGSGKARMATESVSPWITERSFVA
eukprot:g24900.t1